MCLGIPGRIDRIYKDEETGLAFGEVDFSGVKTRTCLECVPDAAVGEYVIVHAGFAITRLEPEEAESTLRLLDELEQKASEDRGPPPEGP